MERWVKVENGVVIQVQPYFDEGFIEAPDWVWAGYLYDGETFTAPPPPPVDPALIDEERDRRFGLGFDFNGHHFQTALSSDRDNILGATIFAGFAMILRGKQPGDLRWMNPDKDFVWIDADDQAVPMDAPTVIELAEAAFTFKNALIDAAHLLKQMDPIPRDFRDDEYWSTVG